VLARTWVNLGKHSDQVLGAQRPDAASSEPGQRAHASDGGHQPLDGGAPWDALRHELSGLAAGAGLTPPLEDQLPSLSGGGLAASTFPVSFLPQAPPPRGTGVAGGGGAGAVGVEGDMALEARIADAMRS